MGRTSWLLKYDDDGTGPEAVLLLHGLGGSRRLWQRLAPLLQPHFRVIAPDLRGAGTSIESDGARPELSVELWCDDLHTVLDEISLDCPLTIVGHSLGASIALAYTLRWPEHVDALVLLAADPDLRRLGPRMDKAVALIRRVGFETWVDDYWSRNTPFSQHSIRIEPELVSEYRSMLIANRHDDYIRYCLAIASAVDLTNQLPEIAARTLVISGGADDRTLPAAGRELATLLPRGEYIELKDVGHTSPLEAPKAVADAIVEFSRFSNARKGD